MVRAGKSRRRHRRGLARGQPERCSGWEWMRCLRADRLYADAARRCPASRSCPPQPPRPRSNARRARAARASQSGLGAPGRLGRVAKRYIFHVHRPRPAPASQPAPRSSTRDGGDSSLICGEWRGADWQHKVTGIKIVRTSYLNTAGLDPTQPTVPHEIRQSGALCRRMPPPGGRRAGGSGQWACLYCSHHQG